MTRIGGDWLDHPGTQAVCAALEGAGHRALLVGGCVRNALLGEPVADIDIATDARPETVIAIAENAGLKAVPTGIDHGTITVVAESRPHEVTTFRKDIATDGRRAVVTFSSDVAEDAARRDFTMNALYASPDGAVIDPLDGLPDLRARRVRFIGEASARIAEDYLRSLRYFRFLAWYGDPARGMDPEALAAIADALDGLDRLSRERVGHEVMKLLAAPDPAPAVAAMRATGVLGRILPGAEDRALAPLVDIEHAAGLAPDAVRRLAALTQDDPAVGLRLSKAQAKARTALRGLASGTESPAEMAYRHGTALARDALALRCALFEMPWPAEAEADMAAAARLTCPVTARDLKHRFSGRDLGAALERAERDWVASGFRLSRADLLARL